MFTTECPPARENELSWKRTAVVRTRRTIFVRMKLLRLLFSRDWKDEGSVIENVLKDEEHYSWDRGRLARNERETRTGTGD